MVHTLSFFYRLFVEPEAALVVDRGFGNEAKRRKPGTSAFVQDKIARTDPGDVQRGTLRHVTTHPDWVALPVVGQQDPQVDVADRSADHALIEQLLVGLPGRHFPQIIKELVD